MLALSKKARGLPRNASLRSDMEKEEPKKKNFFLRHLFDFLLLATLTLGTASFFVVRAVQDASSIPSSGLVANILFEGKPMEILGENGENRNPIDLNSVLEYEEIEIEGRRTMLTIGVRHNAIAVVHSGCPGQECVHVEWVEGPNQPIVCAYNGIYIDVKGSSSGDIVIG